MQQETVFSGHEGAAAHTNVGVPCLRVWDVHGIKAPNIPEWRRETGCVFHPLAEEILATEAARGGRVRFL